MISGEYNYREDVPATPEELEELLLAAKDYLVHSGKFTWGDEDAGDFYGFAAVADENINPLPLVDQHSAPTYSDATTGTEIARILPVATAVLAAKGLRRVALSYREASHIVVPECDRDNDPTLQDWELRITTDSARPLTFTMQGTTEGTTSTSVVRLFEGGADSDGLKRCECMELQTLAWCMNVMDTQNHDRHEP